VTRLRELGAEAIELPTIRIEEPADGGAGLRDAVGRLAAGAYDWVVLTSPNGVDRTFALIPDARTVRARVAAIGTGTAAALEERRVVADLVPERFVAESLLDAFPDPPPAGGRVLLARAAVARDVLPSGLSDRGWEVELVDAYRTVPAEATPEQLRRVAAADVVTFTSSSTVERFLDLAGIERLPPTIACIGPVTAETARSRGLRVDVEANVHTIDGLVDALVAHYA
jgi:uroporphyrinogen-III synthase